MEHSNVEKEVLEIFEILRKAMLANDFVPMETYVAEDYTGCDAGGRIHGKPLMISAYGPGGVKLEEFTTEKIETKSWQNTVIVSGNVIIGGTYQGEKFKHNSRFMDIYALRESQWNLIASQITDRILN
jgi:Domain of unknown function (DUF4440)